MDTVADLAVERLAILTDPTAAANTIAVVDGRCTVTFEERVVLTTLTGAAEP